MQSCMQMSSLVVLKSTSEGTEKEERKNTHQKAHKKRSTFALTITDASFPPPPHRAGGCECMAPFLARAKIDLVYLESFLYLLY